MRRISSIVLILINALLIIVACQNSNNDTSNVASHESALPHGTTLAETHLNQEDQQQLIEASGIVATPMKA